MAIGRVPGATGIQPSIVDAKGDIIAATAADSVSRLAVGTNNQVLMADSAQATGLKYANEATATLTTTGDLLYASAANTPARLGIGSTNQVLTVSGGVPAWATASSGLPAWSAFTPSSFGAITVGNGTVTCRYMESNTTIIAQMKFVFGSTSSISGATFFTLPVAPKTNNFFFGNVYLYDNGAANYFGSLQVASGGVTYLYAASRPATYVEYQSVNATLPFTWTNTDEIYATVVYEKA